MTELGERLRENCLTSDGARRRELTRRRHDLVGHLVHLAGQRPAGGRRVTAQTAERLTETLDAALVDPGELPVDPLLGQPRTVDDPRISIAQGAVVLGKKPAQVHAITKRLTARLAPRSALERSRVGLCYSRWLG